MTWKYRLLKIALLAMRRPPLVRIIVNYGNQIPVSGKTLKETIVDIRIVETP